MQSLTREAGALGNDLLTNPVVLHKFNRRYIALIGQIAFEMTQSKTTAAEGFAQV